jgi:hypothetical protein
MKKRFVMPQVEILSIDASDVLTESAGFLGDGGNDGTAYRSINLSEIMKQQNN